jgi:hypothetical protein
VNVGPEPDVVGEIPAHVVGIFVDHDLIAIPGPVAAEAEVDWSHTEVEAAEPEAAGATAAEVPDVAASEAAGEVAVFPGMIEMEPGSVVAVVVSDPGAVVMDMRSFRMSVNVGRFGMWRAAVTGRRAMPRDESPANVVRPAVLSVLGPDRESENHCKSKKLAESFHSHLWAYVTIVEVSKDRRFTILCSEEFRLVLAAGLSKMRAVRRYCLNHCGMTAEFGFLHLCHVI